jgi:DNA-binding protein HU-beta
MATKAYIINSLAAELDVTKKRAGEIYSAVATITFRSLRDNGLAVIPGIGRLKLKDKNARMGRNPKTGEPVPIPERRVLKLAPSKLAKIRVNVGK